MASLRIYPPSRKPTPPPRRTVPKLFLDLKPKVRRFWRNLDWDWGTIGIVGFLAVFIGGVFFIDGKQEKETTHPIALRILDKRESESCDDDGDCSSTYYLIDSDGTEWHTTAAQFRRINGPTYVIGTGYDSILGPAINGVQSERPLTDADPNQP